MKSLIANRRGRFLNEQIGRNLSAVVLHKSQDGAPTALSTNYLQISLPGSDVNPNTLINIAIGRVHEGRLVGRQA
jgi:hypothetical protein